MGCFNGFNNWLMTRRITYVKFEHNQILRWPPTYGAEVASLMYFMQWVVIGLLKKGCMYRSQQEIEKGMQYSMFPNLKRWPNDQHPKKSKL